MRVVKPWHRLPREVGDAPNIPDQAGQGSEQPDSVEAVPAHGRGLDWMVFKGPFPPKPFYDYPHRRYRA